MYLKSVSKVKVGSPEFIEDAKRLKFASGVELYYWLVKKGKLPHPSGVNRRYYGEIAKNKGFRSYSDYIRHSKLRHIDDSKLVKRKRHVERGNSRQQICYRCKIDILISIENYHHIIPRKFGGSDDDCNRIPLCPTCHDYIEIKTDELISSRNYYNIDLLRFMIVNDAFE